MARYINECNAILRNLSQELRSRCPDNDHYCCYMHCCFINRRQKEVWETWYFWFGLALIGLLMFTSAASFVAGVLSRKRHQLIRVHHQSSSTQDRLGARPGMSTESVAVPVSAITGPDGLIQPHVAGGLPAAVAARYKTQGPQGTATAIFRRSSQDSLSPGPGGGGGSGNDEVLEDVAGPLQPAYPPIQPVAIVRGALPDGGYRQTGTYTEIVLPPGYVDPQPSHKQASSSRG